MDKSKMINTELLIFVLIMINVIVFGYLGFQLITSSRRTINVAADDTESYSKRLFLPERDEDYTLQEVKEYTVEEFEALMAVVPGSELDIEEDDTAALSKKIMEYFDKAWAELEAPMTEKLADLSRDEITARITMKASQMVIEQLGVSEDEVFHAISTH